MKGQGQILAVIPFLIAASMLAIALNVHQVRADTANITFDQSGVGLEFTGTVVTVDGTNYGVSALPKSFWGDVASTHTFAFQSPLVVTANAKQYVWTSTVGLATVQKDPITITASGSITGSYKTQYHITFDQTGVGSDFAGAVVTIDGSSYVVGGVPVSFWWDSGSGHSFSFASPLTVSATKQYFWSSTSGLSTVQSDSLTVAASGSVVGNYVLQNAVTFDQSGVGSDFTGTVVTVDGTPLGTTPSYYNFTGIQADHTIDVSFAINQYTITSTKGTGGTITPLGTVYANYDQWRNFTITPSIGYHIAVVTVDGTPLGTTPSYYNFTHINTNPNRDIVPPIKTLR
jgi:hypothetical protein